MDFRQTIRDEIERQGLSQRKLAAKAGVLQHAISTYLAGKKDINAETLQRLFEALGIEVRPVGPKKER